MSTRSAGGRSPPRPHGSMYSTSFGPFQRNADCWYQVNASSTIGSSPETVFRRAPSAREPGLSHARKRRARPPEHIEPAANAVGDEDEPVIRDEQVVELDRFLTGWRLGDVAADLANVRRVRRVVDAEPTVEVRREHDRVALERARTVLVQVVRSEPPAPFTVVALGHRKGRDLARAPLIADVDEVDVLSRAAAVGLDRLVGHREDAAVAQRKRRVRMRMASGAGRPLERAQKIKPSVLHAEDGDAGIEVAGERAIAMDDRVMAIHVADRIGRVVLGPGSILLTRPGPLGVEARTGRIGEVDRDRHVAAVTPGLGRRGGGAGPRGPESDD